MRADGLEADEPVERFSAHPGCGFGFSKLRPQQVIVVETDRIDILVALKPEGERHRSIPMCRAAGCVPSACHGRPPCSRGAPRRRSDRQPALLPEVGMTR